MSRSVSWGSCVVLTCTWSHPTVVRGCMLLPLLKAPALPIFGHQAPGTLVRRLQPTGSVAVQIRRVLEEWQQKALFSCTSCRAAIGAVRDSLPMSDLGPSGTFVNAYGFMHSITCISEIASGVVYLGSPTSEYSWFPQYAWTTACCACGEHLGWRFTRVSGDGPEKFWGVLQSALRVSPMHDEGCGLVD